MSAGMFNSEQQAHMRELDAIPPERRCWCGWFGKGRCHTCPADKTCADKLASRCLECGADPGPFNRFPTTHRKGCSRDGLLHKASAAMGTDALQEDIEPLRVSDRKVKARIHKEEKKATGTDAEPRSE